MGNWLDVDDKTLKVALRAIDEVLAPSRYSSMTQFERESIAVNVIRAVRKLGQ